MTRYEAKRQLAEYSFETRPYGTKGKKFVDIRLGNAEGIMDEIYNDFQSRICENCISYDGSHKCNNKNSIAHETSNRVYPSDGCREDFERKDK